MSLWNQMRYFKVTSLPKFRLGRRDFSVFKTLVKKRESSGETFVKRIDKK